MGAGFGKTECGFCRRCGKRVKEDPYGLECPEHGEIPNSQVQWRVVRTLGREIDHISDT